MFGIELLLFEKNEMEQKLNFNHNALTIEQPSMSEQNGNTCIPNGPSRLIKKNKKEIRV